MKGATIWQTRFLDHRIRDEDDFMHHVEYIRLNPVKHGYVTAPIYMPGASSINAPLRNIEMQGRC